MNITEETNDYFSTTEKSEFISYMDKEFNKADWDDQQVWDSLKDKLRTTPDRGIKKVSKVFRVDWSKVFKKI